METGNIARAHGDHDGNRCERLESPASQLAALGQELSGETTPKRRFFVSRETDDIFIMAATDPFIAPIIESV